jgi:N-acetylmuramoyl-L-alanine amidase
MNDFTFFLDAGHGGMTIDGHYVTPGKRSPYPPPVGIYEGVNNAAICAAVMGQGKDLCIQETRGQSIIDIDLNDRVKIIDDMLKRIGKHNGLSLSVHSNAFGDGKKWHSQSGLRVLHHPRSKNGKAYARILSEEVGKVVPFENDGLIERDNLYMINAPDCPAVILECGCHTNKFDTDYIKTSAAHWAVGGAICKSFRRWKDLQMTA